MKSTQKLIEALIVSVTVISIVIPTTLHGVFSMLTRNDARPLYYAMDPHSYLYTWEKQRMKGFSLDVLGCEHLSISFSPFGQNARVAFNPALDGIPIGDLGGRWFMPGLLFGEIPDGKQLSPLLQTALENLFPGVAPGTLNDPKFVDPRQEFGFFTIPIKYSKRGLRFNLEARLGGGFGIVARAGVADICQRLSEVCKRLAVRPDCCPLNCCGSNVVTEDDDCNNRRYCCVSVDDGICPPELLCGICNCIIPGFHNLTCRAKTSENCAASTGGVNNPTNQGGLCCYEIPADRDRCTVPSGIDACGAVCVNETYTCARVNTFLMGRLPLIAQELCLDIGKFHEISIEDIQLALFWRQAFEINRGRAGWPHGLVIPFFEFGATVATGKPRDPQEAFGLPFGNNGHDSIGAIGGIDIDFTNSIEFGSHVGVIHFFGRDFCNYPVPTSIFQSGIYPFSTDVNIKPGLNWQWGFSMACYHFLDRFSFWFEYDIVHHEEDCIKLIKPDPAFKPMLLEERSCWKVQFLNLALNYDISPHINLGVLFQIPTRQRNAYKSSTVLFSFNAIL